MRSYSRIVYAMFMMLLVSLCCLSRVESVEKDDVRSKIKAMGQKISKVTSSPRARKYVSGALLGAAFAATMQPFKNAKDHFLVWDFKTSSRRGIFIAMKHIAHEHGILSLFKGVTLSTLIFAPLFAAFAGNYEIIKEQTLKVVKMFKKDTSPDEMSKREADTKVKVDATAKVKADKEAHVANLKAEQEKRAAEAKIKVEEEVKKKAEARVAAELQKQEQQDAAKKAAEDAKRDKEVDTAKANQEAVAVTEPPSVVHKEPEERGEETTSSSSTITDMHASTEKAGTVIEEVAEEVVDATTGEASKSEPQV